MVGIGSKKWKFDLKDLKLSKFSDMRTIDKTHNKFLAHEFEMRFKLFNFARRLFLMLLKKTKIYLYEKILFILLSVLSKYPHNLYLSKISWNEQISKIESRFKIVYFFWYTLRVNSKKGNPTLTCYPAVCCPCICETYMPLWVQSAIFQCWKLF
jgi:hypothetical protein